LVQLSPQKVTVARLLLRAAASRRRQGAERIMISALKQREKILLIAMTPVTTMQKPADCGIHATLLGAGWAGF
jgi:hypothetical protein